MDLVITPKDELRQILADEMTKALAANKPTKPAPEKEVYNNREAMQYLGVSRSTLQRWRADGILQYRKINGSIRYTRADLDAMLEEAAK